MIKRKLIHLFYAVKNMKDERKEEHTIERQPDETTPLFRKVASAWSKQERRKKPRDYKSYTCCPLCGHPLSQYRIAEALRECEKCHAKIVLMVKDHIVITFPSRRRQDYQTEKQARQYFKKLSGVISNTKTEIPDQDRNTSDRRHET